MKDKKAWTRKIGDFLAGKGFYVVLLICTAVIGISAWILLSNGDKSGVKNPGSIASAAQSSQEIMTTANGNPSGGSVDALGKKPEATPKATASPSPKASVSPSAAKSNEDKSSAAMAKSASFIWPVTGDIAVVYSQDELVYSKTMGDWRTHNGIDISAMLGTKVLAAGAGTVSDVTADDMLGTTVIIDHGNGLKSIYANLAKTPAVKKGDKVTLGEVIGSVGNTALGETSEVSHLHFAMTNNNMAVNPSDFLPKK